MKNRILSLALAVVLLVGLLPLRVSGSATSNNCLFFDFNNDVEARVRYNSSSYGKVNYDCGGWLYDSTRVRQLRNDTGKGVLSMSVAMIGSGDFVDKNGKYYYAEEVVETNGMPSCQFPSRCLNVYGYKHVHKYWVNRCAACGCVGGLMDTPKGTSPEGEETCVSCDADFCQVSGDDKNGAVTGYRLTEVTKVSNPRATKASDPYVQTSDSAGYATGGKLNYSPSDAEIVSVRFRMTNCTVFSNPGVRISYIKNNEGKICSDTMLLSIPESSVTGGQFVTVNVPTSADFRSASVINAIRVEFCGVSGGSSATIDIDYIYVGRRPDNNLLFQFSNDAASSAAEKAPAYAGRNYATAGEWSYDSSYVSGLSVNQSAGTMTVNLKAADGSPAIATRLQGTGFSQPESLNFNATNAEYLQIRMKMNNVTSSGGTPTVSLTYHSPSTLSGRYNDIITAACWVADYYERTKSRPPMIPLGNSYVFAAQFTKLVCQVIVGLNAGKTEESLSATMVGSGTKTWEQVSAGNVSKSEYITAATNALNFINNNKLEANYVTFSSSKKLQFQNTLYRFCSILRSYRQTGSLPASIYVNSWSTFQSSGAPSNISVSSATLPTSAAAIKSLAGNTVVAGTAPIPEKAISGEEVIINVPLSAASRSITDVGGITLRFSNIHANSGASIVLDYIYIGASSGLPGCDGNHNAVTDAAVPATCLETGLTEGSHCSICGEVITAQTVIPALGHDMVYGTAVPATCTQPGSTASGSCTRCDYSVASQVIPAIGHTPAADAAVPATCTEPGLTAGTHCAVCQLPLNAQQTVPALGHTIVADEAVPATCTETGLTAGTHCSVCGETVKAQEEIPVLGHDLSETVLSAPDCTHTGTKQFTCSRCDYTNTETIPALGHTPAKAVEENRVEATCIEAGHYDAVVYCEVCHAEISRNTTELPPAGQHTPGAGATENYVAPTCVTPGSYEITAYCVACGERVICIPMTVPATGKHTAAAPVQENAVPATCTEAGSYENVTYCKDCGTELSRETVSISALGHQYGVPVDNADGTHTMTCACGDSITEAHTFENSVCACGAEEVTFGIVSASLRLDRDIDIIFTVAVPEGAQDIKLMVETENGTETLTDFEKDGSSLRFIYADLNPQQIGDLLTATLSAKIDGRTRYDTLDDYSIRQYCINLLNNPKYSEDAKLHTLLSDLLVYGAAAQTYMDYNTDTLVTDALTLTPSTFAPISGKTVSFTGTADANTDWTGAGLILSDKLSARLFFCADSTDELMVKCTINGRTQYFEAEDFYVVAGKDDTFYLELNDISATEFDEVITAKIYRNGAAVGRTVNYSVNTYICSTQNSTDTNLQALVRALYNYGVSAKAYSNAE